MKAACLGFAAGLGLAGCAPNLVVIASPPPSLDHAAAQYVLLMPATGISSAGFASRLGAGTRLEDVGRIPAGLVLRPLGVVLTAAGANIAQADMVVSGGDWTGFYLPVEGAVSPLQFPVPVTLEKRP